MASASLSKFIFIYYIHQQYDMCAASFNERTFLFMKNLDDVQFGFVISVAAVTAVAVAHINVYRLIAIVSMITCNNEFHFMIAPLNFNRWVAMKKSYQQYMKMHTINGKKASSADKHMSIHRI